MNTEPTPWTYSEEAHIRSLPPGTFAGWSAERIERNFLHLKLHQQVLIIAKAEAAHRQEVATLKAALENAANEAQALLASIKNMTWRERIGFVFSRKGKK